jgi:RNA polymerase sigma factor for flagellar operon FliA
MYTKTRKELVLEHLPLVKKVASKIYRRIPEGVIEFEELVNTGVIGLIKAIDRYDENKAKFSTYAYIKIRGEILDYLRKLDFLPRNLREKVKSGELDALKEEVAAFISLEEKLFSDSDRFTVKDILSSSDRSPEEEIIVAELRQKLTEAISRLPEKEQLVLQLIFVEELDLRSISEILGVSVSRVSQLKSSAIKRLRDLISDSV